MTYLQFKVLRRHKTLRRLLVQGTCIAERMEHHCPVLLFQEVATYTEVFFDVTSSMVIKYRFFDKTDQLEPYLLQINIDKLLQDKHKL